MVKAVEARGGFAIVYRVVEVVVGATAIAWTVGAADGTVVMICIDSSFVNISGLAVALE